MGSALGVYIISKFGDISTIPSKKELTIFETNINEHTTELISQQTKSIEKINTTLASLK